MTDEEKFFLFKTARETIANKTKNLEVVCNYKILLEKKGCFVTLTKEGRLRGCVGYILPIVPLYKAVIENAYNAAFNDLRFTPVLKEEISLIDMEISVLSTPEKIDYNDSDDLLEKINMYKDGVIISKKNYSATFLPQVWEQLPDKKLFLSALCEKAGLDSDEWKTGSLDVKKYSVDILTEN